MKKDNPRGMMLCMDQGTAAVIGATVGVVGTISTAVLTYVATRHQVRDQGRVEHSLRLREERREAYIGFLNVLQQLEGIYSEYGLREGEERVRRLRGDSISRMRPAWESSRNAIFEYLPRVDIVGPESIYDQALEIWDQVRQVTEFVARLSVSSLGRPITHSEAFKLYSDADKIDYHRGEFARISRELLEAPMASK
ncbi:hypothetical protein [Streptomyces sp. Amel2xB2]|uniref:hypothetical protein n=1 Tax=Streptomyces sp. Amel2xB2 TaxID=1305829 RepID=UPI0011B9459F|nr:hypothetical protein [Streptomyces sp. Amel2xB2]